MNKLSLKGLWIPKDILIDKGLTDKEKITLSIVLCLSSELEYCFAGNRYLANLLGVTINRVSKIISSLQNKGYITVKLNYEENTKYIRSRELILTDKLIKGIVKNDNTYWTKQQYPIVPKGKDIINIYKKYYNKYNGYKPNFTQREYTAEELNKMFKN